MTAASTAPRSAAMTREKASRLEERYDYYEAAIADVFSIPPWEQGDRLTHRQWQRLTAYLDKMAEKE